MPFKINISEKSGKTFKLETEAEAIVGKNLHDKVQGEDISSDLKGYEFEITGASDKSGFTIVKNVEGVGLKRVLLTYGKGMKKRPRKEGKKKLSNKTPKGLRLKKTVRGKVISSELSQINLKILKQGDKKLSEIFPEQNKAPEPVIEAPKVEEKKEKVKVETKEEVVSEKKESKEEGTQEKATKEEKELSRPDEEPKGEVPKEGIEEAKE